MSKRESWNEWYMRLAELAATRSKDPTTQVGAVIVGLDRRHIALGYNGFPPGVADTPERLDDKGAKYDLMQHAERAVLDNCQFDMAGGTLITTRYPCVGCAGSLISKKIRRLVTPAPPDATPDRPWTMTCPRATEIMEEVGIEIIIMPDRDRG